MLFDIIAPIYGLFFNYQVKMYKKSILKIKKEMSIGEYSTVLDVGSGTGALCHVLHLEGLKIYGAEISPGMLKISKRKLAGRDIDIVEGDILKGLDFPSKSIDIVVSSYVAHGLKSRERIAMYEEMNRIAKYLVILIDYNQKRSIITDIAEILEGGDYFNFIKEVISELSGLFKKVKTVNTGPRSSWYICKAYNMKPA